MLFAFLLAAAAAQAPAAPPKVISVVPGPATAPQIVSVVRSDATQPAVTLLPPSANNPTHPAIPIAPGSWFSADSYPPEAARKGIEGTVRFEVNVDATGKPTACRIVKSSNSDILDQATCRIVMAKGRFVPGARNGKPVADTYQTNTNWRLMGPTGPANGYVAEILDFTKDPNHPTCSVLRSGIPGGPTCDEAVHNFGQAGARENLQKVVLLTSISMPNQQPYRGDPEWGHRVGFVAIDLYPPKQGTKPTCTIVEEDGMTPTTDPCQQYDKPGPLSDADKKNPNRLHIEQSFFALQQASPNPGKCKNGETAAEASSCI